MSRRGSPTVLPGSLGSVMGVALMIATPGHAQDLDDARDALRTGRYEAALEGFEAIARREPSSAVAVQGHARALAAVGRYEDAAAAVRRFNSQNPNDVELHNTLGEMLMRRGRWEEAEGAFRGAVEGGAADALVAKLNLAILRYRRGERAAAMREFDEFIDVYNRGGARTSEELAAVAAAVRYLGVERPQLFKDALRAYDEAIAADPGDLEPRVAVGDLFLEKYNSADAAQSFRSVLEVNPSHPAALLGLARTRHFDGTLKARELVARSLSVNPNLVGARVFLAELEIELENYATAEQQVERALAVNPKSLEALSVLAAARFMGGDSLGYEQARREALGLNPRYADLYVRLAELSARNRLYHAAVEFGRRAVALDESSWRGHALLGINLLRVGEIAEGRSRLEVAFEGDPYDVWTKNTLDLLDNLQAYPESRSGRFVVAIDSRESELLSIYVGELAEQAYDSLARRYGYRPPTPIRVEVFPTHADFSVRTVGLVGLGALGVSFGPVIAMDSPSARQVGEFNWGSTLWHEIAHTFHLGLSDHRVPRWFSEGLAVFEERRARTGWGNDVTPGFLLAYKEDRLLRLAELNNGFTRPRYPEQIGHSYYQASLVCEFIEREAGPQAFVRMLEAYGDGLAERQVFQRVLGADLDEFDERFWEYFETRFSSELASLRPRPDGEGRPSREQLALRARADTADFIAQLSYGHVLFEAGEVDEAVPYLERAKRLFPDYADAGSPYGYLARIHRERGDLGAAEAELGALVGINERDYAAHLQLAEVREELGDLNGAAWALERAVYIYPLEIDLHTRLAELYGELGRFDGAVRERQAVLALDPADQAEALYELARAHLRAGQLEEARRTVLRALEGAPGYEPALELLLEIRAAGSEE